MNIICYILFSVPLSEIWTEITDNMLHNLKFYYLVDKILPLDPIHSHMPLFKVHFNIILMFIPHLPV